MGRTLPPFSQLIESERRAWAPFRRALRKDDQATFDRLFDCAKLHVQAGVYLSRPWPFEVIAMAMLLEHHRRLERLLAHFETLESRGHPATPLALRATHEPPAQMSMLTEALLPQPSPLPKREGKGEGTIAIPPSRPHLPFPEEEGEGGSA